MVDIDRHRYRYSRYLEGNINMSNQIVQLLIQLIKSTMFLYLPDSISYSYTNIYVHMHTLSTSLCPLYYK